GGGRPLKFSRLHEGSRPPSFKKTESSKLRDEEDKAKETGPDFGRERTSNCSGSHRSSWWSTSFHHRQLIFGLLKSKRGRRHRRLSTSIPEDDPKAALSRIELQGFNH
ncbi:OLC1v1007959C1, partial [Oldenlandia corymbosa var. corymbosa]